MARRRRGAAPDGVAVRVPAGRQRPGPQRRRRRPDRGSDWELKSAPGGVWRFAFRRAMTANQAIVPSTVKQGRTTRVRNVLKSGDPPPWKGMAHEARINHREHFHERVVRLLRNPFRRAATGLRSISSAARGPSERSAAAVSVSVSQLRHALGVVVRRWLGSDRQHASTTSRPHRHRSGRNSRRRLSIPPAHPLDEHSRPAAARTLSSAHG